MSITETLVVLHRDGGSFWAESEQVPGWTAAANDVTELLQMIHEGVPFALDREPDQLDIRMEWEDGRRVFASTTNLLLINGEAGEQRLDTAAMQTATATG